jgi:hypothetical protein
MSAFVTYMECVTQVTKTKQQLKEFLQESTPATRDVLVKGTMNGFHIYPEEISTFTPLFEEDDRDFFTKKFVPLLTTKTSMHIREYLEHIPIGETTYECITRLVALGKPDESPLDEVFETYMCTQFRVCHATRMIGTRKSFGELQAACRDFLNGKGDHLNEKASTFLNDLSKVELPMFWFVWADAVDHALKTPHARSVAYHFNVPIRLGSKIGFVSKHAKQKYDTKSETK